MEHEVPTLAAELLASLFDTEWECRVMIRRGSRRAVTTIQSLLSDTETRTQLESNPRLFVHVVWLWSIVLKYFEGFLPEKCVLTYTDVCLKFVSQLQVCSLRVPVIGTEKEGKIKH